MGRRSSHRVEIPSTVAGGAHGLRPPHSLNGHHYQGIRSLGSKRLVRKVKHPNPCPTSHVSDADGPEGNSRHAGLHVQHDTVRCGDPLHSAAPTRRRD